MKYQSIFIFSHNFQLDKQMRMLVAQGPRRSLLFLKMI